MSITCTFVIVVTLAEAARSATQETRAPSGAIVQPSSTLATKLKAEAARLETGPASDLFAALIEPGGAARLKLSASQVRLVGELDRLARDVQRAWLLRGLDGKRQISSTTLADRLNENGTALRAGLVRHAEAIVLEMALEPIQANRLLRQSHRRATGLLAGRYPPIRVPTDEGPPHGKGRFDEIIRGTIRWWAEHKYPMSILYEILRSPPERRMLEISNEQAELIDRLDEIVRNVRGDWLARALEGAERPPRERWAEPPTPMMVDRLSEKGERLRTSVVAHAEAITLAGVLEPEQTARAKRHLWSQSGARSVDDPRMAASREILAILDPEVSSAIRVTPSQREDLISRLEDRAALVHQLHGELGALEPELIAACRGKDLMTEAEAAAAYEGLLKSAGDRLAGCEEAVWEVLSTGQIRAFRRLVREPGPSQPVKRPDARTAPRTGAKQN
jgi:hypothetical protein